MDIIKNYIENNKGKFIEEVRKFLQIPSISGTGEGIEETASYLKEFLNERLGAKVNLLRYGGHPIVYGTLGEGENKIILYNMYDVQPVEPLEEWICNPFEAKIVEDKIIARGAYNTKGALMSLLLGIEVLEKFTKLPFKLIFIFEGEEELGSPSMPKFVEDKKAELLNSELVYFAFPSERIKNKANIILGNKGIVFIELRSKISEYDIHSSLSRGLINPASVLSKIASYLIDPLEGPKIPWLEEKTVSPNEEDLLYLQDIIEANPLEEILEMYKINKPRLKDKDWYISVYFKPTVNIDGLNSGYVGKGTKTITPNEAVMRLDFRIVPNIEPEDVIRGLEEIISRLGLKDLVEMKVLDKYTWSKTDPKSKYVLKAKKVYEKIGIKPYIIPILPGSAPMYLFTRVLNIPTISTAPGHGGRAHAPNEYITLDTIPKIMLYTCYFLLEIAEVNETKVLNK